MPLSVQAAIEAAKETSDQVWVALVTISHPDLPTPMRFVINTESVLSRGNTYLPAVADVVLLDSKPEEQAQTTIRLDAVDQTILDAIDGLEGPITIDLEFVLADFPDDVLVANLALQWVAETVNALSIEGRLQSAAYQDELVPWLRVTPDRFPAVYR